jgi:hypothetical protein
VKTLTSFLILAFLALSLSVWFSSPTVAPATEPCVPSGSGGMYAPSMPQ